MDKLHVKDQDKVRLREGKATAIKTSLAIVPNIRTSNQDRNEVNSLSCTDQNHNNLQNMNYNCRINCELGGRDIRKTHTGAITADIVTKIVISNGATKSVDLDYQVKNDNDSKRPTKLLDSMIIDTQTVQKSWQTMMTGANECHQYHHQIVTRMLQNQCLPTYVQMMTASVIRPQVTGSIEFEMKRGKPCYWKGELPPRNYRNPVFSTKVFIGGVPWDITEPQLLDSFSKYGLCRVEWPSKESRHSSISPRRAKITGYVYMIFESDLAVKKLLQDCSQEFGTAGEWYFKLTARRANGLEIRQVQVIPWVVTDALYILNPNVPLEAKKTVFVGGLHGMITAQVLFSIMRDVYGDALFVGIDTDRQKYPIGSARVTFSTLPAYFRAIESGYLEIHTSKFTKKVQIDPFLEDAKCSQCECVQGPYFCREKSCFKYFCLQCWEVRHALSGPYGCHKPMIRSHRRSVQSEFYTAYSTTRCAFAYDPRTAVSHQYFSTFKSEIGIQMKILPAAPDRITQKTAGVKLAFGQPIYMLPTYSGQPPKQIQVCVPSTNQSSIVLNENKLKTQGLNAFRHIPLISSSPYRSRNELDQSDLPFPTENIVNVNGTLSLTSASSSPPTVDNVSTNAL